VHNMNRQTYLVLFRKVHPSIRLHQ
jgi:hypothetical protein